MVSAPKYSRKVRESLGDAVFNIINYLFVTLIALTMLYPILNVLAISLASYRDYLARPWMFISTKLNFEGYKFIFRNDTFLRGFANSVFITVVGTLLGLLLTILTAYPLSRRELRWKPFFTGILIFTMVFSAGMIPGYLNMQELKLTSTIWSMIIPGAFSTFNCILMMNSFRELPVELIEAAEMDGASEPYILFRVVVPLSKAVIATIALFLMVGYWNSYMGAQIYCALNRDVWPLAMILKQTLTEAATAVMNAKDDPAAKEMADKLQGKAIQYAAVVVSTVPIMCVYPFLQKYFAKGALVGGVKG